MPVRRPTAGLPYWVLLGLALATVSCGTGEPGDDRISVTLPDTGSGQPLTGRLVVIFSAPDTPEPRLLIHPNGPQIFGMDVEERAPGDVVSLSAVDPGYPLASIADLADGEYNVQAILNVYESFTRADGRAVWLPLRAEGRLFHESPGNWVSEVVKVTRRSGNPMALRLELSRTIETSEAPEDSEHVKHVKIRSERLSRFWGRDMFLEATVLLPRGYAEHREVHYPAIYVHGHFRRPFLVNTDPNSVESEASVRSAGIQPGYEFFQTWMSDGFPRMLAISLITPTPFFPDSYAANSPNSGPYRDAIMTELIPHIEESFRTIRQPYARVVEGASTGGWTALSQQLRYPEFFGGAWIINPDPISFERFQLTDIYGDDNAFARVAPNGIRQPRPYRRTREGQVLLTVENVSRFESVLGSRGRSGFQQNAWEAYFGPRAPDGYPTPLWDKASGEIDRSVADYMRENGYDLLDYAKRNWSEIGPELCGKLHFLTGDMDDYYLNPAVYRFERFLESTYDPNCPGDFVYGRPMKGHSWRPYDFSEMVRQMARHIESNAPVAADPQAWRY